MSELPNKKELEESANKYVSDSGYECKHCSHTKPMEWKKSDE